MSLLRTISDLIIAARQPISEDLIARIRDNLVLLISTVVQDLTGLLAGTVDSVSTGTITDANPTGGVIEEDDQFNGHYIRFTSGTAFSNNSRNKFKIISVSNSLNTITVTENLASLGVAAADTYVILGHTHDGSVTDPNGAKVELKNLTNSAEDQDMDQALSDAITDPDSVRTTTVDKTNPFAPFDEILKFTWVDDGTKVFNDVTTGTVSGLVSISSQVPVGTVAAQLFVSATSPNTGGVGFRDNGSGTYRNVVTAAAQTDPQTEEVMALVPVNSSRQIDRSSFGGGGGASTLFGEVRAHFGT